MDRAIVSEQEWLTARRILLDEEKALTRAREAVARKRRELPWVKIEKDYEFEGSSGPVTLAELFNGRTQLIIQHFMYGPDWQEGCKSCSFWADQFNPAVPHLNARDVSFAAVSLAPYSVIEPFKQRMGWSFDWVSSAPGSFSNDFHAWYTPEQIASGDTAYNFQPGLHYGELAPGLSVFVMGEGAVVYHTYSCYARGLDALNGCYQLLDLVPKGRDEADLPMPMSWLQLHDSYA